MKKDVKYQLKAQGKEFSEGQYQFAKFIMHKAMAHQPTLKEYLNISLDFKVAWIVGNWDKVKEIFVTN